MNFSAVFPRVSLSFKRFDGGNCDASISAVNDSFWMVHFSMDMCVRVDLN